MVLSPALKFKISFGTVKDEQHPTRLVDTRSHQIAQPDSPQTILLLPQPSERWDCQLFLSEDLLWALLSLIVCVSGQQGKTQGKDRGHCTSTDTSGSQPVGGHTLEVTRTFHGGRISEILHMRYLHEDS